LVVATGCSTQKNTARTRWWHSFKARYNTYYNGSLAYIDASLEKEEGNKDNFTELIPLYTVSNKNSREIGKSNYDRAIEKCQKTIKLHSIKRRPQWTKQRKKTAKDLEWLSRREYNPFLWKAWLLMGRSQFYKGAFDEAAATFNYMSRLYQTQPAIYAKSRAWLAKCYIEEGWLYDAEDVIRNMQRDSIHWSARKEWDYTYADYYIHTGEYEKAIPHLRNVIKHEMRRKQRAREWFLMGQMQAALGNNVEAMKAFKHVTKLNPPYELEFNARISMTEVMSVGQSKKMIGRLKRMARSDKNKEYLDQVYYAIGNIYLAQSDTAQAINAYERGAAKATRSGIEKGVLLLKLGDIYWEKERYNDAQRCYGQAIGMLDKERKDYEELSNRSKILDDLVPYTDAIHLQVAWVWQDAIPS
jgi:tetratricopeptide (TPR) repeat protein